MAYAVASMLRLRTPHARALWSASVVALWLATTSECWAWGDEGHRAIGELASRRLSPETRAAVDEALTEPGYRTLADAATWPDTFARGRPEYDAMRPFHYVNVQALAASYLRERDCPHGCVVTALSQFVVLLERSKPSEREERRRCIYWIAHLIGDLHQPLHVAHPDGMGGSRTRVPFFELPEAPNAHWIWDVGLLARRPPPPEWLATRIASDQPAHRALADELMATLTPARAAAYSRTTSAEALADEALAVSRRSAFLESTERVDEAYLLRAWPVAAEQLRKAGVRLAAVLDRALGDRRAQATR